MPRTRNPYPADFREQIVALARSGRSVEELAREFEPCAATIHGWIKQADRDGGRRTDDVSSESAMSCGAFAVRTASFARREISWQRQQPGSLRATRCRLGLRAHDGEPGHVPPSPRCPRRWAFRAVAFTPGASAPRRLVQRPMRRSPLA